MPANASRDVPPLVPCTAETQTSTIEIGAPNIAESAETFNVLMTRTLLHTAEICDIRTRRRARCAAGQRLHMRAEAASFPPPDYKSRMVCDDGTSMRVATLAGAGISMGSMWSIHRELKDGSLVRVLPEYEVDDGSAIWLVYPRSNMLTAKVRAFIDFLIEKIGKPPVWEW